MKKALLLPIILLLSSLGLHAQTTAVTGNLRTVLGEALGTNTFIRIRLRNFKPNRPLVSGVGIIGQTRKDVFPDSVGLISTNVYDNNLITPNGTFYTLEFYFQGRFVHAASYTITGATFDFNTATPLSTAPTATIPNFQTSVFVHIQATPATTWTIVHSFGVREADLEFFDTNFIRIFPDLVTLTDTNTVTAQFVVAQSGRAIVMRAEDVNLTSSVNDPVLKGPTSPQSITGGHNLSLDGNFLLAVAGQDICSNTVRCDIFALTLDVSTTSTLTGNVTFGASLLPLATGQDIGSASVRPDALLEIVTTGVLNNIRVVDGNKFATLDAAINDLPSAGGTVLVPDGNHSLSTNVFAGHDIDLDIQLGCGTYTISVAQSYAPASNNRSFRFQGRGKCTILQPSIAMTVLTVNMGTSNYQGLYLADFALDLNQTNSTALSFVGAGQKGVVERIYITNNLTTATANVITVDNTSHDMRFEDIRIRGSATADCISTSSNAVILDGLDITGCKAAVIVPAATSINALTVQNSRLDDNVNALRVDGAAAQSITYTGNHSEGNTASHLDLRGFDGTTNRIFNLSILGNYFTQMNLAAEDGITLFRVHGVEIRGNRFRGTGTVAEAVTFDATVVVTNVALSGNTVNAVSSSMTGFSAVPLEVDDVTIAQASVQGAFPSLNLGGNLTQSTGSLIKTEDALWQIISRRQSAGGVSTRFMTRNASGIDTARVDITGQVDTAQARFPGARIHAGGTALVAGDFALSAGWGTTASVGTITGFDQWAQFTITSTGTGQAANPTATLTFQDGTWADAPVAVCQRADRANQAGIHFTWTTTATTLVLTFEGTPVAAETFVVACHVGGI